MQDIPEDILIKAAEGDVDSYEIIYKAAASFVYNVAYRVVRNREDAEEVTQDVFLIVYRKLKEFRFESSLKTWIYRITVNCAINFAKKSSKVRNKMTTYDDQMTKETVSHEAYKEVDKEYYTKVVNDMLGVLNPDQRACIVLRNIEGLSYQEVAEALKININTVRSRLKRARESLLALRKKVGYEHV